jgi:hypothetical protein
MVLFKLGAGMIGEDVELMIKGVSVELMLDELSDGVSGSTMTTDWR